MFLGCVFMKKYSLLLILLFAFLTTFCQAQGNMYIIQKSGETLVVPISNIDSITHHATLPTISTVDVSDISYVSATSGGFIKANGGTPVTARGVCWSTTPNPTISGNKTVDGSGSGSFTSNLTGLSPNKTYYVRSYATNSVGTAYGVEKTFTCLSEYLSSLSMTFYGIDIPLSPAFVKTTESYTATVGYSFSSVKVKPVAENINSTITVNGTTVSSGASSEVYLSEGPNTINVTVSYGGIVHQVYDINITRGPETILSSLNVMSGSTNISLDPEFEPTHREYLAYVDYDVDAVTITPTSESPTSTIRYDYKDISDFLIVSGTATESLPLEVGPNDFRIKIEDYGDGGEYIVKIIRRSNYLTNVIITDPETGTIIPLNPTFSIQNQTYTTVSQISQIGNKIHVDASLLDPTAYITYTLNNKLWYSTIPEGSVSYEATEIQDPNITDISMGQNTLLIKVIPTNTGEPERVYTFNMELIP
jgi:hypothetical protein